MKKLILMLLVLSLAFALASCKKECTEHVDSNADGKCDVCEAAMTPAPCTSHTDANADNKCDTCGADLTPVPQDPGVMTYAQFAAAELNSEVTVVTYVQAKQGWWEKDGVGIATFYTQASDGAYFLYEMPCTQEQYNALVPGTCIKVTGYKAEFHGEVEILDATFEVVTGATSFIAEPKDITTELLAGADISAYQNQYISIEYATVSEVKYNWDGSGSEGSDLYLTLSLGTGGETTITVVVESYLHGNGSAVYEAVEALRFGEIVSIDAFLYWYDGAQPHVNAIVNPLSGVISHEQYDAAELNSEVTVITYVQAKQGWWEKDGVGVATFYTQAPDGGYYLYEMPCTKAEYDTLVPGTCIKVTGYKAEFHGEVEIVDATFEIAPGYFYNPDEEGDIVDITDDIAAGSDVIEYQNMLVEVKNATVTEVKYGWDGSGYVGGDIYLSLNVGGAELTVVVESYLHGDGTAVYDTVEALEAGDVVSIEAFLYWYDGAQPHVNAITVAQ